MCVAVVAIAESAEYPFVIVHNRDEFYARPSSPLALRGDVAGGTDDRAGGMWLGIRRAERPRFAFVTNFRAGRPAKGASGRSRGELVGGFLEGEQDPHDYLDTLEVSRYRPFNLVLGGVERFYLFHGPTGETLSFGPGVHAFSNGPPGEVWSKSARLAGAVKGMLRSGLDEHRLVKSFLQALSDPQKAPDEELPSTGVPKEWEQALSSIYIETPEYGTVASTVILGDRGGAIKIWERARDARGRTAMTQLNL